MAYVYQTPWRRCPFPPVRYGVRCQVILLQLPGARYSPIAPPAGTCGAKGLCDRLTWHRVYFLGCGPELTCGASLSHSLDATQYKQKSPWS